MEGTAVAFTGVEDRRRQMAAYDSLPVTVRRAVDAAPYKICCEATVAYWREHGARAAVREVRSSGTEYLESLRRG